MPANDARYLPRQHAVARPQELPHGADVPSATVAGVLIGFSLGGFFDGILLHQVLQWHHLLSGLDGARGRDLRFQVLADGLFHAAMYVVAIVGLWRLHRAARALGPPDSRTLAAALAAGFGLWHVVDTFLSHWLLGIHRIRQDSPDPLFWDLLWLAVFGVVPVALGWRGLRRGRAGRAPLPMPPGALAVVVLLGGVLAALPPRGDAPVLALYAPNAAPDEVMDGIHAAGGSLVWFDARAGLWAVELPDGGSPRPLYDHGALLVSRSAVAIGCFGWLSPRRG
jgi:uncharacterized membrane protein